MKAIETHLKQHQLFDLAVLFWVIFGWLALLASIFGVFYSTVFSVYIFLGVAAFLFFLARNREKINFSRSSLFVVAVSLLLVFIFSRYTTPSVFSGRDQGAFSEAAIRLTQNHHLKFSTEASREFFKIYGSGRALNFPGFDYTKDGQLITQFPLGYTSWLAAFYGIFGLNGLVIANAVSFFIFLLSFFAVSRNFTRPRTAFFLLAFVASSFIFSWFFKFTVSENLALMLLWFGIYGFLRFMKTENHFNFFCFFSAMGLLAFSRIEALAILMIAFAIIYMKNKKQKKLIIAKIGQTNIKLIVGVAILYVINFAVNINAYVALAKGLLKPLLNLQSGISGSGSLFMPYYVAKIFIAYAMLGFVVIGIFGIIYLFRRRNYSTLIPFFLVLPAYFYLLQPAISLDHPWMLRRFMFAVIPASILYTGIFLENFFKKRVFFYAISAILLLTNLIVFLPYINFSPNKDLLAQIEKMSENFGEKDLVLIDQSATGDGWSMMTGPLSFLYGKQAVYFFNPEDVAKLDRKKFENIYLIILDDKTELYKKSGLWEKISVKNSYTMKNDVLGAQIGEKRQTMLAEVYLPEKKESEIRGKIYLFQK